MRTYCGKCISSDHRVECESAHSVTGGEELGKNAGEQLDLARASDELVIDHGARVDLVLDALEQEGVLADLPELHELVAQTLDTTRFAATHPV